jgi:hypothetical protein
LLKLALSIITLTLNPRKNCVSFCHNIDNKIV